MKSHWARFITDSRLIDAANKGVDMLRLPIGDWTLNPYGPYVGCTDGAADEIQDLLDHVAKYNMTVLFDIHAMKGS